MNPTARPVGHGIQPVVEAVLSAGGNPKAIRTAAWHAAWARGYDDIIIPAVELGLRAEGFLIVVQPIGDTRFAAVVDTGSQLLANHDVNGAWDAKVIDALTLGFHVALEPCTSSPDVGWMQPLKDAMNRGRESETHRRRAIDHSRSALPTIEVVPSVHDLLATMQQELGERIKIETAPKSPPTITPRAPSVLKKKRPKPRPPSPVRSSGVKQRLLETTRRGLRSAPRRPCRP